MTAAEVARAWNSVTDRWIARREKMHDSRQYEVVHDWGGDVISDDTMKVISRHETYELAEKKARKLEDEARGAAVLAAMKRS